MMSTSTGQPSTGPPGTCQAVEQGRTIIVYTSVFVSCRGSNGWGGTGMVVGMVCTVPLYIMTNYILRICKCCTPLTNMTSTMRASRNLSPHIAKFNFCATVIHIHSFNHTINQYHSQQHKNYVICQQQRCFASKFKKTDKQVESNDTPDDSTTLIDHTNTNHQFVLDDTQLIRYVVLCNAGYIYIYIYIYKICCTI